MGVLAALPAMAASKGKPSYSITIDDVAWSRIPAPYQETGNGRLLGALKDQHDLKAALFVAGTNVDSAGGQAVLEQWSRSGHMLANHTWSHHVYNASIEPQDFAKDLLRCDALIRQFTRFRPFFRFPALKEGATPERRDWMRGFLREHGYRNGYVTIDASDWYYDQRLRACLEKDRTFDVNRFRAPYLAHIWDRAVYYDRLARQVTGGTVPHTLLLHFNLLNTLFLGDLLRMFQQKGWQAVDAETAFRHSVFQRQPDIVPAGESLIWALAKETGRFERELRYPGEDSPYEESKLDRLGL